METISAGDIEKYAYCPLSWWLSRGDEPVNEKLKEGIEKHKAIEAHLDIAEKNLKSSRGFERAVLWSAVLASIVSIGGVTLIPNWATSGEAGQSGGFILAFLALVWLLAAAYFLYRAETYRRVERKGSAEMIITIFSIVALLLALYSVTFVLPKDSNLATTAEALALMWLIGASLFLYKSLVFYDRYSAEKRAAGIKKGELIYHDTTRTKTPLLRTEKYGITGRPDYILTVGDDHIPVEVKTGRVPRGPLFSHRMQLYAYCLLVEDRYQRRPPYGILQYSTIAHELEFDEKARDLVITKVKEMQGKRATGDVHRNHNRETKCKHCSRRSICPERLA